MPAGMGMPRTSLECIPHASNMLPGLGDFFPLLSPRTYLPHPFPCKTPGSFTEAFNAQGSQRRGGTGSWKCSPRTYKQLGAAPRPAKPQPPEPQPCMVCVHQQKPAAPTPLEGFCLATFPLKRNCSLRKVPWSGNKRLQNA